jgi:arginyl-tRNA synthetase
MKEAVDKATNDGRVDLKTAKAIGYGAVKYAILKASNDKNVVFDWDTALSFDGDSGPYLQYSLVRIHSIFRKYGKALPKVVDYQLFNHPLEIDLLRELAGFPGQVENAVRMMSPHIIAGAVYGITKRFSSFYHECPVLNAENEALQEARLVLIDAVRQVLMNGFYMLGIEPIESM